MMNWRDRKNLSHINSPLFGIRVVVATRGRRAVRIKYRTIMSKCHTFTVINLHSADKCLDNKQQFPFDCSVLQESSEIGACVIAGVTEQRHKFPPPVFFCVLSVLV